MIKFFRKIRQNLLNEGKTGKYFKYAIGEIVLVVIGILIALSINNWNENRKTEMTKDLLLQELKQEFQENLVEIENFDKKSSISNEYLIKVLNYSAGKEKGMTADSLRKYSANMFHNFNLAITKSSLDGVIASGNISLFDSELTSLLRGFETDFNSFGELANTAGQKITSKASNDLLLNLNFYQSFHKILYPNKSIEIHSSFNKNDEDFIIFIKDPNTYSTINELYVFELGRKAWVRHLKLKVKNIITTIEANQSNQ